ncbi:hypothetical protein [Sphingomonas pokkalii]|uniref:hypothetical protein n=1 Tax=Sphingomonas pokkalii TaxID=2175090 RepID=UPI001401DDB9|nr:hypothetical protein [Sphingomonas pokkalii]
MLSPSTKTTTPPAPAVDGLLLLARAGAQGVDVVTKSEGDAARTDRAVRRAAA